MFTEYLPLRTTLFQAKKIRKITTDYNAPQAWLLRYLLAVGLEAFDVEKLKEAMERDGLQVKRGA